MNSRDAEKLNEMLLQVSAKLHESVEFVKDNSSGDEECESYTKGMAKVLGHLFWHIKDPLWEKHPELKPDYMDGGSYKVDPGLFEPKFYESSK